MAAVDVSKMSDEELEALAGGKQPKTQDFSKMSDEELERLAYGDIEKKATQPLQKDGPSFTMEGVKEAAIQQLPMIGTVVGGGLGVVGGPVGSVAGAGTGAALGKGLQQLIRGYQQRGSQYFTEPEAPTLKGTAQAASGQAIAGLEGVTAEMGGQVLAKGIGAASQGLGQRLKEMSEKTAFRASGGMLKDARKAMNQNRLTDIGRTALDKGIVTAGDDVANVAEKATAVKAEAGKKIGEIYKAAQAEVASLAQTKAIDKNAQEALNKLMNGGFRPTEHSEILRQELQKELQGKVGGNQAFQKLSSYLDEIAANGDAVTLPKAVEIKGDIDGLINYSKRTDELPAVQQGLKKVRTFIQKQVENQIKALEDTGLLTQGAIKELKSANQTYGNASEIARMATDKVARVQGNNAIGLSEKGFGMAGVLGAAATQDPEMLVLGLGAAGASKLSKKYGAAIVAKAFDQASKVLLNNPAAKAIATDNPNYMNFLTDQIAAKMTKSSFLPAAGAEDVDPNNPMNRRLKGQ